MLAFIRRLLIQSVMLAVTVSPFAVPATETALAQSTTCPSFITVPAGVTCTVTGNNQSQPITLRSGEVVPPYSTISNMYRFTKNICGQQVEVFVPGTSSQVYLNNASRTMPPVGATCGSTYLPRGTGNLGTQMSVSNGQACWSVLKVGANGQPQVATTRCAAAPGTSSSTNTGGGTGGTGTGTTTTVDTSLPTTSSLGRVLYSDCSVVAGWALGPGGQATSVQWRFRKASSSVSYLQYEQNGSTRTTNFPANQRWEDVGDLYDLPATAQAQGHWFEFSLNDLKPARLNMEARTGDEVRVYALRGTTRELISTIKLNCNGTYHGTPGQGDNPPANPTIPTPTNPAIPTDPVRPILPGDNPGSGGGGGSSPVDCGITPGACYPRINVLFRNLERCGNYGLIQNGAPSRTCDVWSFDHAQIPKICAGDRVTIYVGAESPWPGTVTVAGQTFNLVGGPGSRPSTHYVWGSLAALGGPEYFEVIAGQNDVATLRTNGQVLTDNVPLSSDCAATPAPTVTITGTQGYNSQDSSPYNNSCVKAGEYVVLYGTFPGFANLPVSGGTASYRSAEQFNLKVGGTPGGTVSGSVGGVSWSFPVCAAVASQPVNYSMTIAPNPVQVCSPSATGTARVTIVGPSGSEVYNNSQKLQEISTDVYEVSIGYNSSTPIRLYRPDGTVASEQNLTSSAAGCNS